MARDLIGETCGELRITHRIGKREGISNVFWAAVCSCGTALEIHTGNWGKTNKCKSCACRDAQKQSKFSRNEETDLYMLRCGPYIKIGTTKDIQVRLRTIQSCNPLPVELVGLWKGMGHLEESWHGALKERHVSGEWFLPESCS